MCDERIKKIENFIAQQSEYLSFTIFVLTVVLR